MSDAGYFHAEPGAARTPAREPAIRAAAGLGLPAGTAYGPLSFLDRRSGPGERALFALLDGLMAFAGAVLRLGGRPLKEALVRLFGDVGYLFGRRWKRTAFVNLRLAYGDAISEEEKRRIVRGMFRHFIRTGLDFLFDYVYWPPDKLRAALDAGGAGASVLAESMKAPQGRAAISGHLGNLELVQRALLVRGHPLATVFKSFDGPWFDRYVGRRRLAYGISLIETPSSEYELVDGERRKLPRRSIRGEVLRAWEDGKALAFACDQYSRRSRFLIEFLGVPDARAQVGALAYAVERRAPLTFHALVYDRRGEPRLLEAGPFPIEEHPDGPEATLRRYVQLFADWLSERVREHPEQYAWGHRRFDRRHYEEA